MGGKERAENRESGPEQGRGLKGSGEGHTKEGGGESFYLHDDARPPTHTDSPPTHTLTHTKHNTAD